MQILGISCYYHDAAACLVRDGTVIAAAEEERFTRVKSDASFPKKSIDFCLSYGRTPASRLDYVVFYEKPFRKLHRILLSSLATYPKSYASFREAMRVWLTQKLWIKQEIASSVNIPLEKILFTQHHMAHAASAFYPSPFKRAAILTVDAVGEWTTTSYGIGDTGGITLLREMRFPQSLGLLYSAFTAFLGFEVNEGEWKVMGLAPYGKPRYADRVWKMVRLRRDGGFTLDLSYFSFPYSDSRTYSQKFIDVFGPPISPHESHLISPRAADIAASIQAVTEKILLTMAKTIQKQTGMDALCFSGGVALNSVANYRILREAGFKKLFIPPAAGDSGGAMGGALYVNHLLAPHTKRTVLENAYFGKEYTNRDIEQFLKKERHPFKKFSRRKLLAYTAKHIGEGRVIGWLQGRFEWGPRALGNRSILADARRPDMKDIINSKVKFREAFRPFAPSVLSRHAHTIFDLPPNPSSHYPLRFMLYVVPVRGAWQKRVPAINHADNSARPNIVIQKENPLYHALLTEFYKHTGVPLVLNTSFNLRGEPIVTTPGDAYSTFERSGIDILVMGNYVCEKPYINAKNLGGRLKKR